MTLQEHCQFDGLSWYEWDTYRSVGDYGISDIGEHAPNVPHSCAELFGSTGAGDDIPFSCIQAADEGADTGAYILV